MCSNSITLFWYLAASYKPRNYRLHWKGNSARFFFVCWQWQQFLKELFAPTLNGIAVSVWHGLFTPVVLHAGLNDHLRRMQTNEMIWNEENWRMCWLFKVEHEHWNPVASLDYERVTKSDIYVTMKINLYKPIKNASLLAKKHPFTSYSTAKHRKRSRLRVTSITEKTSGVVGGTKRALALTALITLLI